MKREILFRGLRTDGDGWVEGLLFYSHGTGIWSITASNGWLPSYSNPDEGESTVYHPVHPETVGQFTGLLDKNGKKVFEGDIVTDIYDNSDKIEWLEAASCSCCNEASGWAYSVSEAKQLEIIGTIHDDKEATP